MQHCRTFITLFSLSVATVDFEICKGMEKVIDFVETLKRFMIEADECNKVDPWSMVTVSITPFDRWI